MNPQAENENGAKNMTKKYSISVVIPVFNEEHNIVPLCKKFLKVLNELDNDYEILFINDGSMDKTSAQLEIVSSGNENIKVFSFDKNRGKSAALTYGFARVEGDIIITMDGDLQDEPQEIPRMIEKLNKGYDVVSGWKYYRRDPFTKTFPSKVFNVLVSRITGLKLHDFNCGFKAYRKKAIENLHLSCGYHRFIPALLHAKDFRISEIKVQHHKRVHGKSKYGAKRLVVGFLDLFKVRKSIREIRAGQQKKK